MALASTGKQKVLDIAMKFEINVSESAVNDWYGVLAEILKYAPRDIYNAVESALYYNLLPDKTLAVKDDTCKGGKQSKERATLLLCTNLDGSDKVKPFLIL
jgi:hypothetical protein